MESIGSQLRGRRVLITGGTGFIGGRLVERLVQQCGATPRIMVRSYARAARVARFPVEMVRGDLAVADDVQRAVAGCEVVFHCGVGIDGNEEEQRVVTLDGTRNVLDAAAKAGDKRVVNISTINVYGPLPDGDLDETRERVYAGDVYSDSKLDAEKATLDYAKRGLPAVVLQPTVVYGPFGPAWTVRILNDLKTGRVILVNGGEGLCNAVYVDDVVTAMLLAAESDAAVGEAFLISAEQPITWREYYGGYERMLDLQSTVDMDVAQCHALFKEQIKRKSLFRESFRILREEVPLRRQIGGTAELHAMMGLARRVVPGALRRRLKSKLINNTAAEAATAVAEAVEDKPVIPIGPGAIQMHAAKTRVRIDKAARVLGYQPAFDFAKGIEQTEQWARWANLL